MLNYKRVPDVDTKEKALQHLESQGMDTSDLRKVSRPLFIIWAAKAEGFYYPNWHSDLFRSYERGSDVVVGPALKLIEGVNTKEKAIAHLKEIGIDTDGIKNMADDDARVEVGVLAGDAGCIYPNYRPL